MPLRVVTNLQYEYSRNSTNGAMREHLQVGRAQTRWCQLKSAQRSASDVRETEHGVSTRIHSLHTCAPRKTFGRSYRSGRSESAGRRRRLPRHASRTSAPLPDCYSAHSQPTGAVSNFSPNAAAVSSPNNGSAQSANPPTWARRRSAHLSTRYSAQSTHCEADRVLINARSLGGCYMLNDRGTQHNSWKPIVQILNWALYFL